MQTMRRCLFSAIALVASATSAHAQGSAWPRSTPEKEGLLSAPLTALVDSIKSGKHGNVDRLVVVRNGKLVLSERFARDYNEISKGKKSAIGCGVDACTDSAEMNEFNYLHPTWHPFYKGRQVHTLQSVTKSVTATLIGIAIGRSEIKSVNEPLLSFFDAYDLSKVDARLRKATLADLLTMRSGIEWHEVDRPLDDTNTTLQLEKSRDWIAFTLRQPMAAEPGTMWAYNSGTSALMAEIIRRSTGQQADEYAEKYLFSPLGMRDYYWKKTPTGHPDTEGGLYLESEDLARIGQLYLNDGVWNGKRILPAGWAKEATTRHVANTGANPNTPGYGYQWWRYDRRGADVWAGNGFGGQFIIVVPAHSIVAVANSWNVFGAQVQGVLRPMIDAVLDAANVPR
jgi:CubicO group peptidase (beta-lactamase class C family)